MSTKPYKQNQEQAQGHYLNPRLLDGAIFTIHGTILPVDDPEQSPLYSMSVRSYALKLGVSSLLSSEMNLVLTDSSISEDMEEEDMEEEDMEEEDMEEENHSSKENIPKEQKKLLKVDPSKTIAYRQDGFDFKGFFRK